jgi:hypothetical protein
MKLLFVRFADYGHDVTDGGSIFDRRLLQAITRLGADVDIEDVTRNRAISVPIWRSKVPETTLERVRAAKREGRTTIVSHESLFHIAQRAPVDGLVVHNYFPAFTYNGRPLLERYYRSGAMRYYAKSFRSVKSAFFISHREHRIALEDFPELAGRTDICVPPPFPRPLAPRTDKVVHLSGSEAWLPKRLSMLTDKQLGQINAAGYTVSDFDDPVSPSAALINDRFEVGFKLKLVQMLSCRDVIASFCDLSEEINALCPGHPFYKQVNTVSEALAYFANVWETYTSDEIDTIYETLEAKDYLPSWDMLARQFVTLIDHKAGDASIPIGRSHGL